MTALLRGDGLSPYAAPRDLDAVDDPIAGVMVAAKTAVGRFGGALRRLLYAVPRLTPDTVRAAQTLTEQITQKALSVKAGDPPVSVGEFGAELRRLLSGEEPPPATGTALRAVLAQPRTRAVWERLRAELGVEVPAWLRWLQSPHDLAAILTETGTLTIPTDDPRAAAFLAYAEPAAKKS